MGEWVTGTHVFHPHLLTHLTHDPRSTHPLSALRPLSPHFIDRFTDFDET